ncbi:unnamed protein product, partial [Ectocarpus sp. 8 AP-2014]
SQTLPSRVCRTPPLGGQARLQSGEYCPAPPAAGRHNRPQVLDQVGVVDLDAAAGRRRGGAAEPVNPPPHVAHQGPGLFVFAAARPALAVAVVVALVVHVVARPLSSAPLAHSFVPYPHHRRTGSYSSAVYREPAFIRYLDLHLGLLLLLLLPATS